MLRKQPLPRFARPEPGRWGRRQSRRCGCVLSLACCRGPCGSSCGPARRFCSGPPWAPAVLCVPAGSLCAALAAAADRCLRSCEPTMPRVTGRAPFPTLRSDSASAWWSGRRPRPRSLRCLQTSCRLARRQRRQQTPASILRCVLPLCVCTPDLLALCGWQYRRANGPAEGHLGLQAVSTVTQASAGLGETRGGERAGLAVAAGAGTRELRDLLAR